MRETAASSEKIPLDSRPPFGEELQDLLTEKTGYLLYRPLLTLDLVSSFVFMDLAHV